jgi:hypothetical protein
MTRLAGDTNGHVHGDLDLIRGAIGQVRSDTMRKRVNARHAAPADFTPGAPLVLAVTVADEDVTAARLHFRHVNQAEAWQVADATPSKDGFAASIAAGYTASPFSLQYYFELRGTRRADLFPGLADDLANQPYVVTRRKSAA